MRRILLERGPVSVVGSHLAVPVEAHIRWAIPALDTLFDVIGSWKHKLTELIASSGHDMRIEHLLAASLQVHSIVVVLHFDQLVDSLELNRRRLFNTVPLVKSPTVLLGNDAKRIVIDRSQRDVAFILDYIISVVLSVI